MINVETVISGLECCTTGDLGNCKECPYGIKACNELLKDAISLLKAQQPRVMTLEEVRLLGKDDIVWYERKGVFGQPRPRVVEFVFDDHITFTDGGVWSFSADGYGERWRLWTSRPTDEQREAMKWNE